MIMSVFSVVDGKTGIYSHPFYDVTRGSAVRAFQDTVRTKDHPFNRHPEDYTLVFIGTYDDNTGRIVSEVPEVIATASNLIVE